MCCTRAAVLHFVCGLNSSSEAGRLHDPDRITTGVGDDSISPRIPIFSPLPPSPVNVDAAYTPARFVKPVCDFTYGVFLLMGFFKGRAARVPLPAVDGQGGLDPSSFVTVLPTPEVRIYCVMVQYGIRYTRGQS